MSLLIWGVSHRTAQPACTSPSTPGSRTAWVSTSRPCRAELPPVPRHRRRRRRGHACRASSTWRCSHASPRWLCPSSPSSWGRGRWPARKTVPQLDLLLSNPVPRRHLIVGRFATMIVGLVVILASALAVHLGALVVPVDEELPLSDVPSAVLNLLPFSLFFGGLALLLSATLAPRAPSLIAIPAALLVAMYVVERPGRCRWPRSQTQVTSHSFHYYGSAIIERHRLGRLLRHPGLGRRALVLAICGRRVRSARHPDLRFTVPNGATNATCAAHGPMAGQAVLPWRRTVGRSAPPAKVCTDHGRPGGPVATAPLSIERIRPRHGRSHGQPSTGGHGLSSW